MQKFELWGLRSGSVRPNIYPSLECLPHFRNAGSLSWHAIGMLATMFKGEIHRGDFGSRERGELKLYGINESIASAISEITDILPE